MLGHPTPPLRGGREGAGGRERGREGARGGERGKEGERKTEKE